MRQVIRCNNSDHIYVCDSDDAKCCLEVNNVFIVVDLEKEVIRNSNKKILEEILNYNGKHPDFMIIKVENNKIVLELLEFKRIEIEKIIFDAITYQLLYFYWTLKEFIEKKLMLSEAFNKINQYKFLIVVPCNLMKKNNKLIVIPCDLNQSSIPDSCEIYHNVRNKVNNFKKNKGEREKYIKSLSDEQMKILLLQLLSNPKVLNSIDVACCKSL